MKQSSPPSVVIIKTGKNYFFYLHQVLEELYIAHKIKNRQHHAHKKKDCGLIKPITSKQKESHKK